MFGTQNKDWWQFDIRFSNDDKANSRPGADVGMTGLRNKVMCQWAETPRKVPTVSFILLLCKVYITSSTSLLLSNVYLYIYVQE